MNGGTYIGTNDANGQAYAGLMDIAHAFTGWGNDTATITFSGLTLNNVYLLQLWVADYRNYPNDRLLDTYRRSQLLQPRSGFWIATITPTASTAAT